MKAIITLCLVLTGIAHARIGDTQAELEKRYGKPKGAPNEDGRLMFEKDGMRVSAYVRSGKCDSIMFTSMDPKDPAKLFGPAFTKEQTAALLANNPVGAKWKELGSPTVQQTEDKKYKAIVQAKLIKIDSVAAAKKD